VISEVRGNADAQKHAPRRDRDGRARVGRCRSNCEHCGHPGQLHVNDKLESAYGQEVEVRTYSEPGFEMAYAVTWNKYFQEWSFVSMQESTYSSLRGQKEERRSTWRMGIAIEGVRVEPGSPGFSQSGPMAFVNFTGKNAPRTNVARTSLERTPEFQASLARIYAVLTKHVA
jgi:hypothetical protein